jgi:hypothetical protein
MICPLEKIVRLQTALQTMPKPHYDFLLPPKEGEGQDEGAVIRISKSDNFR